MELMQKYSVLYIMYIYNIFKTLEKLWNYEVYII